MTSRAVSQMETSDDMRRNNLVDLALHTHVSVGMG